MIIEYLKLSWWLLIALFHILGFIAGLDAIMRGRTSQGSIAWAISLLFFPYIALPLYLIFGSRRFYGYIDARRTGDLEINHIAQELSEKIEKFNTTLENYQTEYKVVEHLAKMPFTSNNNAELL
ncbi:MAG: PLDc N-terminal domain-containing protein, partial [Candidatus Cloacimonetes bacterium]|nr:PLDc N-terminal domain-containing protein [Candidatus Cloacimonadota bacterium]